ncbi:uncharacterized protein Z520_10809 [Fonsecaea multimorphosa CBS 102226]|uniref:Cystathionine gamma-synthase n=1 Tax=Fonsecaea multimorphosa CBS 102226 TaxID=1442371 RepID=A0A0D2GV29_9EURO|nr:uncharacterized protein Z520_10809 [Fonsecaea multimorphosa CBS 102226]KIX93390.1 hypothetical protein Z520_10809 [Fonsecaea multimorphosa CBS 102226]OAL18689.1 hypothetical protein AYO22_10382 [Fonsecaea multimorphosa]
MALEVQTPHGTALPPAPRHAITVHVQGWQSVVRFRDGDPELFKSLKSMYPRFVLHRDVLELTEKISELAGGDAEQGCLLFPSWQAARDCKEYATSPRRGEGAIPKDRFSIRIFQAHVLLYAVMFPVEYMDTVHGFWVNAGVGISSRLAEDSLKHTSTLREVQEGQELGTTTIAATPATLDGPSRQQVKERIAGLLNRAPATNNPRVSPSDVYLFSTGMASIYWVHRYLLSKYDSPSALFGFSFHSTIHVLEDFGPGVEFFGLGSDQDLDRLEKHLATQQGLGGKVQAIWAESPSNPLLSTPDLRRLRQLADEYSALLVVDDTVGGFCNVDVLGAADIVVTSLTKSFSGYADVMAGSAVLSPLSPRYEELKGLFESVHHDDLYIGDVETLEHNSRDYLERSAVLNRNAERVVEYLQSKALDPSSTVKQVFYPTVNLDTLPNYTPFMRRSTPEFPNPGYGCLLSVEFQTIEATIAFYENLHVHKGPHLGAHLTLALPYALGVYGNKAEWASAYNVRQEQVRISVGLEETEELVDRFRRAVEAADRLGSRSVDLKN